MVTTGRHERLHSRMCELIAQFNCDVNGEDVETNKLIKERSNIVKSVSFGTHQTSSMLDAGYSESVRVSFLVHPISPLHFVSTPSYNPTANPKTAAPTTAPIPTVTPCAPPVLPVVTALAAATCNPNCVETVALPFTVLVTTLVAVVLAEHPAHDVHGADVFHGPSVQPGQSEDGHAEVPHQLVHAPERQSERVAQSLQGPKLEEPQGPGPEDPVHCQYGVNEYVGRTEERTTPTPARGARTAGSAPSWAPLPAARTPAVRWPGRGGECRWDSTV
jgi:hypothetical protein